MTDYEWTHVAHGFTLTKSEIEREEMIRIPDPWWRRILVKLRLAKPRYRRWTINDLLYRDGAGLPPEFRGMKR